MRPSPPGHRELLNKILTEFPPRVNASCYRRFFCWRVRGVARPNFRMRIRAREIQKEELMDKAN